jgi:molecular chaperone DnaJ
MKGMLIKDYYKILDVPPAATLQEIKRSFRRLAQQYHPDKNAGSQWADAQYREIQEAYKVLSDPRQREEYNYKRWFNRSTAQDFIKSPITPLAILQECRSLQKYVSGINVFHVRYEMVTQHIKQLLAAETIGILHEYNDTAINHEIVHLLLQSAHPLPLRYFNEVANLLMQVAGSDNAALGTIEEALKHKKQRQRWDQYKWVIVVLLTALILWMMYWVGK